MTVDMSQLDTSNLSDLDVYNLLLEGLKNLFTSPDDANTIQQLAQFIDSQITSDVPMSVIALNLRNTQIYKDRFAGNEALKLAGFAPLSEAQYLAQEQTYAEVLRSAGLGDLATRQNMASMIGGSVSPAELQDRVANVYSRIKNADEALSKELDALRGTGNISNADLAGALLMGKEGTDALKRKISMAEINAEATKRGLKSALGTEELLNLGINRQQAAQGFEAIKQNQETLQKLGDIYGAQTSGLQTELEKEQFMGLQSQLRKKLTQQELGTFGGQSGVLTQASKSSAGKL